MEVLTQLLQRAATEKSIKFHPKCRKLTHLMFADDMFIYSHGPKSSIAAILSILQGFSLLSGLSINNSKSEIYSSGIPSNILKEIVRITGFKTGCLPIRYLGIPLITKRLSAKDCEPLIQRITQRISSKSPRHLSNARRPLDAGSMNSIGAQKRLNVSPYLLLSVALLGEHLFTASGKSEIVGCSANLHKLLHKSCWR